MKNRIWIELPELVELDWRIDLKELHYSKVVNNYNTFFYIIFTNDKVKVICRDLRFMNERQELTEYRELDLFTQVERMMGEINI